MERGAAAEVHGGVGPLRHAEIPDCVFPQQMSGMRRSTDANVHACVCMPCHGRGRAPGRIRGVKARTRGGRGGGGSSKPHLTTTQRPLPPAARRRRARPQRRWRRTQPAGPRAASKEGSRALFSKPPCVRGYACVGRAGAGAGAGTDPGTGGLCWRALGAGLGWGAGLQAATRVPVPAGAQEHAQAATRAAANVPPPRHAFPPRRSTGTTTCILPRPPPPTHHAFGATPHTNTRLPIVALPAAPHVTSLQPSWPVTCAVVQTPPATHGLGRTTRTTPRPTHGGHTHLLIVAHVVQNHPPVGQPQPHHVQGGAGRQRAHGAAPAGRAGDMRQRGMCAECYVEGRAASGPTA